MIVLGFPECATQSADLAGALGCEHALVDIHRFPDGESRIALPPSLPQQVVFHRPLNDPNAKITELLIAEGAARALGATHITLVAPYLCYMRQDIAFAPGQAVSQRVIGTLLARHFDAVVTIDPHLHRVATLAEAVPSRSALCLTAAALLGEVLRSHIPADALLLGPDAESRQWVSQVAALGGFAFDVARKERFGDRQVRVTLPDVDVTGRTVVLVDDVISSGRTMTEAAHALRGAGAASLHAIATHGLFAGNALAEMRDAGIDLVWVTDTTSPAEASNTDNGPILISTATLIAEALRSSGNYYR